MGVFPNTVYLEFFSSNLALNRYSFLLSTCILTLLTILHIINLCTKSKANTNMNENSHTQKENTANKSADLAPLSPISAPKIPKLHTLPSHSTAISKKKSHESYRKSFSSIRKQIITVYKSGKQGKYVILSHAMIICTMIFFIFHGIIDTLDFYGIFHGVISCRSVRIIGAIFWHTGKTTMYFIFYSRLQLAFYDTAFQYSNKTMYGLLFLICNFWFSCMIGDAFEILGELRYDSYYNIWWCQQYVPLWGCIVTPIYDGLISLLCLYLFISPLYKIVTFCDKLDISTIYIIIKYVTLTFIAVFTTTLVLAIQIFKSWGVIFCFDVIVNVISIMLMSRNYNYYYKLFCGCTDRCATLIVSKSDSKTNKKTKETNINVKKLEEYVESNTTIEINDIKCERTCTHNVLMVKSDVLGNSAMIL
eukprot:339438_1